MSAVGSWHSSYVKDGVKLSTVTDRVTVVGQLPPTPSSMITCSNQVPGLIVAVGELPGAVVNAPAGVLLQSNVVALVAEAVTCDVVQRLVMLIAAAGMSVPAG